MVALETRGFEVEAWECSPRLVPSGNSLLAEITLKARFPYCPPNKALVRQATTAEGHTLIRADANRLLRGNIKRTLKLLGV